ncbi:MAG: transposase [Candidatus Hodarchaeota archaeon]
MSQVKVLTFSVVCGIIVPVEGRNFRNMDTVPIYRLFPSEGDCIAYLENIFWGERPICPYCRSENTTRMKKEHRHHCNTCYTSFSVTVGTIFHRTRLPLQKWFLAIAVILNAEKDISARKLARYLRVNKDTAWRMNTKIREAMAEREQRELLISIAGSDGAHTALIRSELTSFT